MTRTDRWLLPEGIEEALPAQARALEIRRRELLDLYRGWGYELVITPFIEYLESLLVGNSSDLDLQTFKLTDQLNGRLMGVRADMTPQVARIDAHVLHHDGPVRLCYLGTVLRTRGDNVGGTRSPMQLGAELYGHAGMDSDLEIVSLMLETLRVVGIRGIHLDLGHVGIYRGLVQQAGLQAGAEYELFDMLQRKAGAEIEAFLAGLEMSAQARSMLGVLAGLHGGAEVLARARRVLHPAGQPVLQILDHLDELAGALAALAPDVNLHFDLAELRGYHYHTGMVFAAYVPGCGQEIARGGRYDDIGSAFGRARPATGFSADLKMLCELSPVRPADGTGPIFVAAKDVAGAREAIEALRRSGERVICELRGQQVDGAAMGCDRTLLRQNEQWLVKDI